jgi:hypothetical protein
MLHLVSRVHVAGHVCFAVNIDGKPYYYYYPLYLCFLLKLYNFRVLLVFIYKTMKAIKLEVCYKMEGWGEPQAMAIFRIDNVVQSIPLEYCYS